MFLAALGNGAARVDERIAEGTGLDVVASADWVVDLGPGAGKAGGRVVVSGPPPEVARAKRSGTARYLAARSKDRWRLSRTADRWCR